MIKMQQTWKKQKVKDIDTEHSEQHILKNCWVQSTFNGTNEPKLNKLVAGKFWLKQEANYHELSWFKKEIVTTCEEIRSGGFDGLLGQLWIERWCAGGAEGLGKTNQFVSPASLQKPAGLEPFFSSPLFSRQCFVLQCFSVAQLIPLKRHWNVIHSDVKRCSNVLSPIMDGMSFLFQLGSCALPCSQVIVLLTCPLLDFVLVELNS